VSSEEIAVAEEGTGAEKILLGSGLREVGKRFGSAEPGRCITSHKLMSQTRMGRGWTYSRSMPPEESIPFDPVNKGISKVLDKAF